MRYRRRDPDDEIPAEIQEILRALAAEDPDGTLPAPADDQLRAYREGRLTPEEIREMEDLLARSAAGRNRLLELAGIDQGIDGMIDRSLPLRRVRKAVLGANRRRTLTRWVSAAAALAASIVLVLLTLLPLQRELPAGLAYDVSARGLAEVRSPEEAPGQVGAGLRAYPGTPLRILVRPRGDSPAGLSFALFRREGGALRRVREPEEVRLASDRGSAAFEGAAGSVLAARAPGVYLLYVVVSAREDLPSRVELEPGQDPAGALRSTGRLVYPVTVILLREGTQ